MAYTAGRSVERFGRSALVPGLSYTHSYSIVDTHLYIPTYIPRHSAYNILCVYIYIYIERERDVYSILAARRLAQSRRRGRRWQTTPHIKETNNHNNDNNSNNSNNY